MTTESVTVLLIEDDAMVRGWVRFALEESEFFIVGEATNAEAARELVERRRPFFSSTTDCRTEPAPSSSSGCAAPA